MRPDALAITQTLGVLIFFGALVISAFLSARLRNKFARALYLVWLLLMNVPAIWFLVYYGLFTPPAISSDVLGHGLAVVFVLGPFGLAWLLGWPLGLPFRKKRTAQE